MTSLDALLEWDRRHLWHPFTQQALWGKEDEILVIDRAEGFHLIGADGRRFLDGVSSLWCNVHGHQVPEIDDAIRAQLGRVAHSTLLGLSQTEAILLAKELLEVAPAGLTRVFYSDSGATAVEIALKMAVQYQTQRGQPGKRTFLTLSEAYHGDTVGALSLGFSPTFHHVFRHLAFPVMHVPPPHGAAAPSGMTSKEWEQHCQQLAEQTISEHGHCLAAVVLEPLVQGAAGMLVQPSGYVRAIADACRRHNVLLICDEVATGFGRTGTLWACSQEGVAPDILCVAKGLSGGYLPLAATLTQEHIYRAFLGTPAEGRTFFHGHTFTGNALGCAAARASLALLKTRVLPVLPGRVEHLRAILAPMAALPHVAQVRQRGLMVGIELAEHPRGRVPYPAILRMGHRVCMRARDRGVILRPLGNVVVLMPAPAMPEHHLTELATATLASITDVTEGA
jgi:adenosylmethionine-8-amino-7-oxononanoate aminotransferase